MENTKHTLVIYGQSDDLVEFEGKVVKTDGPANEADWDKAIADNGAEFNLYLSDATEDHYGGYFAVDGSDGSRFLVHPIYTEIGCWTFAVSQAEEGVGFGTVTLIARNNRSEMPPPVNEGRDRDNYTAMLMIERDQEVEWTVRWWNRR